MWVFSSILLCKHEKNLINHWTIKKILDFLIVLFIYVEKTLLTRQVRVQGLLGTRKKSCSLLRVKLTSPQEPGYAFNYLINTVLLQKALSKCNRPTNIYFQLWLSTFGTCCVIRLLLFKEGNPSLNKNIFAFQFVRFGCA